MPGNEMDKLGELLALVDHPEVLYFELETSEIHVVVARDEEVRKAHLPQSVNGANPQAAEPPVSADRSGVVVPPAPADDMQPIDPADSPEQRDPSPSAPSVETDHVVVRSPMVGTFYSAPEPGAPPYASVGAMIEAEATVGLIEAMKVFTAVRSPATGTVAEVLVENSTFVEFDQPLLVLVTGDGSGR